MESDSKIDIIYRFCQEKIIDSTKFIIPEVICKSHIDLKNLLEDDGVDIENIKYEIVNENNEPIINDNCFENIINTLNVILYVYDIDHSTPKTKPILDKINEFDKRLNNIEYKVNNNNDLSELSSFFNSPNIDNKDNILLNEEEDSKIDLSYIYANPLINKNDLNKKFKLKDNNYLNDINNIYNIFKSSERQYNIEFNPIINEDDFKNYLIKAPRILHISCNVYQEKNNGIYLCLENKGEYKLFSEDDIKNAIQNENKSKNIECIILNTSNINIGKCFFDAGIVNVISIFNENLYPNQNIKNEKFISCFYKQLIKGETLYDAYKKVKNEFSDIDCIFYGNNYNNKIFQNELIKKGNVKINDNCILNCKIDMDNNIRIIGRNKELYDTISFFTNFNEEKINFVYGHEGIGKEFFIKKVGTYLFERKYYSNIKFIEFSCISQDVIFSKIPPNKNNNSQSNLLLIKFDFEFNDINSFENLKNIFDKLKQRNKNSFFLFSITIPHYSDMQSYLSNFNSFRKTYLRDLEKCYREDLFKMLNYTYCDPKLSNKNKDFIIGKGYPNIIYLRVCYFNIIPDKKYKDNHINDLTNNLIIKEMISKNYVLNNIIFSLFTILYKGISNKEIQYILKGNDIKNLEEQFNLIITKTYNHILNDYFYKLDNSLIKDIYPNLNEETFNDCLKQILKLYSGILRNIIMNSDINFDISDEFNAGINQGFWLTFNNDIFQQFYYNKENDFSDKKFKYMSYYKENMKMILLKYKEHLKKILSNDILINGNFSIICDYQYIIEYFEQISICLPTLIYKLERENCKDIIDLFSEVLEDCHLNLANIRLLIFKFSISKEADFSEASKYLNLNTENAEFELCLLKLDQKFKGEKNIVFSTIYEQALEYFTKQKNYFNLSKLNYFMGKYFQENDECLTYYKEGIENAKKCDNYYLEAKINIYQSKYYLSQLKFEEAQNSLNRAEEISKVHKYKYLFKDITELSEKIYVLKAKKKKTILTFIEANQFFDTKKKPICSLSNGAFNFKQKLQSKLPKNVQIKFEMFNKSTNLQEILLSSRIIYIGSDYYDKEGNLYYEGEDGESILFPFDDFCESFNSIYDKEDIILIILGFLNSERLGDKLIKLGYSHIIMLPNIKYLNNLFSKNPTYIIQYKEFLYEFVENLLSYCVCKNLNEAFINSYNIFNKDLSNSIIPNISEDLKDRELILLKPKDYYNHIYIYNMDDDINNNISVNNNSNELEDELNQNKIDDINNIPKEISFYNQFPYIIKMFGRKNDLNYLIRNIEKLNYLILFGESGCGKTKIGIEVCKYFSMRKKFDGIDYYNLNNYHWKGKIFEKYKNNEDKSYLVICDNATQKFMKKFSKKYYPKYLQNIHCLIIVNKKYGEKNLKQLSSTFDNENEIKQFYIYLNNSVNNYNVNLDNILIKPKEKEIKNIMKSIEKFLGK